MAFLKVNVDGGFVPIRGTDGSAGLDLYTPRAVTFAPNGALTTIDTGVRMAIPNGYYGQITDKSSVALKYNFQVAAGVIDSDYRGKIVVMIRNLSNVPVELPFAAPIAQLIIIPYFYKPIELVSKVELGVTERNEGGFGSTTVSSAVKLALKV